MIEKILADSSHRLFSARYDPFTATPVPAPQGNDPAQAITSDVVVDAKPVLENRSEYTFQPPMRDTPKRNQNKLPNARQGRRKKEEGGRTILRD